MSAANDGRRAPKRPRATSSAGTGAGKSRTRGRHERAVEAALLDLDRAGLLAPHTGHLRAALRANGRALDEAEAAVNAYGTRQATRSILEISEQLMARRDDEDTVAEWVRDIPDHVPEDLQ